MKDTTLVGSLSSHGTEWGDREQIPTKNGRSLGTEKLRPYSLFSLHLTLWEHLSLPESGHIHGLPLTCEGWKKIGNFGLLEC